MEGTVPGFDFTEASFDASHKGEYADQLHGHTWFVRIEWPAHPPVDAREMHRRLLAVLSEWDHTVLDGTLVPTNYGVAEAVSRRLPGLTQVTVWRAGSLPCGARWVP